MPSSEEIKIKISADDKASGVLSDLGKTAGGLGGALGTVAKTAGIALVAGLGAATAEAVRAIGAFDDSQKVLAQMDAVLQSTHGAAGLFKEDLIEQAAALQRYTTYNDEAVMSAQNLLLTFTSVKGPIFQQAIGTILDMSTALGQDLKSSAIQVGKALQDPILGVSALRRVGVNFSEDQQKLIKTMVETGKVMEAQKYILAELNTEFGGSAHAATQTFSGAMTQLKNAFNDLEETVGKVLVEAITPFVKALAEWAQRPETQERLQGLIEDFKNFLFVMNEVRIVVVDFVTGAVQRMIDIWHTLSDYFNGTILPTLKALWEVAYNFLEPAFSRLWTTLSTQLWPALQELWEVIEPVLLPAIKYLSIAIGSALYGALLLVIRLVTELANILTIVLTAFVNIAEFIIKVGVGAWKAIKDVLDGIVDTLTKIIELAQKAATAVSNAMPKMNQGGSLNPFSSSFQLPHFASGGIVTGPTVAMVGEAGPEAIIPLNKMGGMGGINVNITGTFLSDDAAERVGDMLINRLKMELRI